MLPTKRLRLPACGSTGRTYIAFTIVFPTVVKADISRSTTAFIPLGDGNHLNH